MRKKISIALLLISCLILLLFGCNHSNPITSIQIGNKTLTYNMSQSDIENTIGKGESMGSGLEDYIDDEIEYNKSLRIAYKNHKPRYFEIDEPNIITYNNIKVGDSIPDVITKYKYEQNQTTRYVVAFKNGNEIDTANKNQTPDYWIGYCYQYNLVTAIQIYDNSVANHIV